MDAFLPLMVEMVETEKVVTDVINRSSIGAMMIQPGSSAYGISKLALCRLGEYVELEYADKGANVVDLNPGGVRTGLYEQEAVLGPCKLLQKKNQLPHRLLHLQVSGSREC
jgi:short-subunit dehydrogenase